MDNTKTQTRNRSRRIPYSTFHKCPECGEDFYGRSNRKYCSEECKIKSNNDKAREMNSRVSEQVRMLKKNAQILDYFYSVENKPISIDREEMINNGFIINCPTIQLKDENGTSWNMIGRYVFRVDEKEKGINLMTKDDLKNL